MPLCPHCSQDVPAANAQLHELRCSTARNSGPHGSQGASEVAAIASSPPLPASTEQGAGAPPPSGEDGFAECPLCEEIVSSSSYEAHLAQCSVTQQHEAQSSGGSGSVPPDYASRRGAAWVDCPLCFEKFPQDSIERHAATCAGGGGGSSGRPTTRPRSPDKRRRAFTRLRAIVHRSSNSSAEGDVAICVRQGDLTLEATDCIVNPANDKLMHGSGVAGALVRFGGDIIQDISDVIVAERGPIPVGEAVVTEAGRCNASTSCILLAQCGREETRVRWIFLRLPSCRPCELHQLCLAHQLRFPPSHRGFLGSRKSSRSTRF